MVASWWERQPSFGVGVSCGPAGLVVLDVDAHGVSVPARDRLLPGIPIPDPVALDGLASGYDTLALLAAYRRQPNPAEDEGTLRVRTPSGGLHIWYRNPRPGLRFRSSTGSSPQRALAWQVDVRAHGGYIVAPGTVTPAGVYTPRGAAREPADLPRWLAEELVRTGHARQDPTSPPAARRAAGVGRPGGVPRILRPMLEEVLDCAATPEGAGFTAKLNRSAFTAGGLIGGGSQHREVLRQLLLDAARHARPRQVRRNEVIVDAGLDAGACRPLSPKDSS